MYFLYSDISEIERIGEEVVMVYFKVLNRHSPGATDRNHKKSSVRIIYNQDSNQAPPEYKSKLLSLESTCLLGSML
jgi:hypothetical protein